MNLQHERLAQLCAELRLGGVAVDCAAEAQRAAEAEAAFPDFLEAVLRAEIEARRARARQMPARAAGFPAAKTLDQYDFEFAAGAPRRQILQLAGLGFVERAENVVLLGPSGVGKTHVSIATPDPRPRGKNLGTLCCWPGDVIAARVRHLPGGAGSSLRSLPGNGAAGVIQQ